MRVKYYQSQHNSGAATMRYQGTEVKIENELPVHPTDKSMCDFDVFGQCVDCGQDNTIQGEL